MPWLAPALVVVFLILVGWLSDRTHEDAEKILKAVMADVGRANKALSGDEPDVARAREFLNRWV